MDTTNTPDLRAGDAAISAEEAFRPRASAMALHSAERHVDRWAPEQSATSRSRSLRSLAFVDRLVTPWVGAAQHSAALRLFGEYASSGWGERAVAPVSWVFPRPWYQDELDWMAAARMVAEQQAAAGAITTRGTYVQAPAPRAFGGSFELVAPSLTIASASALPVTDDGRALPGLPAALPAALAARPLAAWSPLVPFAAAQAAQVFAGAIGQAMATGLSSAERSPILGALSLVAPADATGSAAADVDAMVPRFASAAMARPAGAPAAPLAAPAMTGALQAQLAATLRQIEAIRAQVVPALAIAQAAPELVTPPAPSGAAERETSAPAEAGDVATMTAQARATVQLRAEEARVAQAIALVRAQAQAIVAERAAAAQLAEQAQRGERAAEAARAVEAAGAVEPARAVEAIAPTGTAASAAEAATPAAAELRAERAQVAAERAEIAAERATAAAASAPAAAAPIATAPSATAAPIRAEIQGEGQTEIARAADRGTIAAARAGEAEAQVAAAAAAVMVAAAQGVLTPAAITSIAQAVAASPDAAVALRTIELITRAAASGHAPDAVGGPRVALPAGLGGLIAGFDTAGAMHRPMMAAIASSAPAGAFAAAAAMPSIGALAEAFAGEPGAATAARPAVTPAFAPVWAMPTASIGALAAVASERPAAVDHVAWTDRWLARFAGASAQSLGALDAIGETPSFATSVAMSALAARAFAGDTVYVAPAELAARATFAPASDAQGEPARGPISGARALARAGIAMPAPVLSIAPPVVPAPPAAVTPAPATPTAPRFDDAQSVPDDVFAAIFAPQAAPAPAPRGATPAAQAASATATATPSLAPIAEQVAMPSVALVDRIARSAPVAPGAGLHAGLASSPMAPALAALLSLPSAPAFDARALYTAALAGAYLDGVLAPSLGLAPAAAAASRTALPLGGAPWTEALPAPSLGVAAHAPAVDYVAPLAARGEVASTGELAPGEAPRAARPLVAPASAPAPAVGAAAPASPASPLAAAAPAPFVAPLHEHLAAIRSTLLASPMAAAPVAAIAAQLAAMGYDEPAIARATAAIATAAGVSVAALDGGAATAAAPGGVLAAPLADAPMATWTASPGMTAAAAQSWSVAHERASTDLAFDFVPPELVLAARVYGFGPIEAAQAQRLAIAGPGGLAAMATALDLTFLRAVQAGADPTAERAAPGEAAVARAAAAPARAFAPTEVAPITAFPTAAPAAAVAPSVTAAAPTAAAAAATATQAPSPAFAAAAPGERTSLFGVDRRLPRGAFLWPSATVGAAGLEATSPDGYATLPVAALELLAASAVADLGAWVVARGNAPAAAREAAEAAAGQGPASTAAGALPGAGAAAPTRALAAAAAGLSTTSALASALGALSAGEPSLDTVADDALPSAAAERRARFQAVYLAIAQTSAGRSLSPSARAARALALLSRDEEPARRGSSLERAAAAWSMMPVVLGGDEPAAATGERAGVPADARPGMQALSARAGEALSSFVAPSRAELATARGAESRDARDRSTPETVYVDTAAGGERAAARREREVGAVRRPPTARPEMVRTGVPGARLGGGEPEIPTWFESAARKILADRTPGSDMSVAELTLVTAAPARQVAADDRSAAAGAPTAPSAQGGQSNARGEKPDIDKIAQEVYGEILRLIDIARERNGEPYL